MLGEIMYTILGLILSVLLVAIVFGGFYLLIRLIVLTENILYLFKKWLEAKEYNRIKFNNFISFYNINSENWMLHNYNVAYKIIESKVVCGYGYTDSKTTEFGFSLIDLLKYRRWKAQSEINKNKKRHLEEYQEVLDHIKKDIEKMNRKNEKMIKCEAEKIAKHATDIPCMFVDEAHPVHAYAKN